MKNWNAPEVKELNIAKTENGVINGYYETSVVFNDSKKSSTPTDEEKPENQLS